jgi:putative sigma-54 modulation protein
MKIIIQSPDFKVTKKLSDSIKRNVDKLKVWNDRIVQCNILLKVDKSDTHENKICELKLEVPGNDVFAYKQSNTFEAALLECITAVKHQLTRRKDSANKRRRRAPSEPV